ncbi:unnamed protein product [Amaranthus hypochondriacus]
MMPWLKCMYSAHRLYSAMVRPSHHVGIHPGHVCEYSARVQVFGHSRKNSALMTSSRLDASIRPSRTYSAVMSVFGPSCAFLATMCVFGLLRYYSTQTSVFGHYSPKASKPSGVSGEDNCLMSTRSTLRSSFDFPNL